MLPTRVQGTRLPYTFPPHYLLNATFHAERWMLPTRVQGTRLPYTFPPHYLLNATFHVERWMLPTRVQGTRLPYTLLDVIETSLLKFHDELMINYRICLLANNHYREKKINSIQFHGSGRSFSIRQQRIHSSHCSVVNTAMSSSTRYIERYIDHEVQIICTNIEDTGDQAYLKVTVMGP